ncbi:MAG: hypothetical protein M1832_003291 [Thelocarpon impressellum]|nr:MAG: hypothetical protein M1832_003291 [Thelocarpon impressellum]
MSPRVGAPDSPSGRERSLSTGSTIEDPNMDHDSLDVPSSPVRSSEPDPRNSLYHLLADDPPSAARGGRRDPVQSVMDSSPAGRRSWVVDANRDATEDEAEAVPASGYNKKADTSQVGAASGGRRAAQGAATSSIYGGNKMKNIKKEDGVPLWRSDIQYEFLRAVFDDETAAFTNIKEKQAGAISTFAHIYIDAMATSPKTSKILREKLLSDRPSALNMAMVCLLVNVGRMNTTLNFFPEMRAQLRTYHAIPCLQAKQDPNAYKQLQDAPRLKSILKGACEDKNEPGTIDSLRALPVPRTNPVNLIFVLSQYAPKLTELHFSPQLDFFDLVTRTTLSSRSRARGFLWLMWWYLESDFSVEDAARNPFGAGLPPEVDGVPQKLPSFEHLTEEQKELENVDTQDELEYGRKKQEERRKIMEMDAAVAAPPPKRGKKSTNNLVASDDGAPSPARDMTSPHPPRSHRTSKRPKSRKHPTMATYHSDTDRTRSASPPGLHPTFNIHDGLVLSGRSKRKAREGHPSQAAPRTGRGRWLRDSRDHSAPHNAFLKTRMKQVPDSSSPAPPGPSHPILHPEGPNNQRRPRPLTAHQIAVERNRQQRVDYLLDRRLRKIFARCQKARARDGAIWRAWTRHEAMAEPLENSEDEGNDGVTRVGGPYREHGPAGLIPLESEADDFGEELASYAAAVRRAGRRLKRWDGLGKGVGGVMGTRKMVSSSNVAKAAAAAAAAAEDDDEYEDAGGRAGGQLRGSSVGVDEGGGGAGDELDDMDRELLGEMDGDEGEEGEGDEDEDEMDVD